MRKTTITISFDDEKLSATRRYLSKKNIDLDTELSEQVQKLYEKCVPANVQEYIAEREDEESLSPSIKRKKPADNGVISAE